LTYNCQELSLTSQREVATMRYSTEARYHSAIGKNDGKHSLIVKASYVFLTQLDLLLSIFGASLGAHELNPLMRNLLTRPEQLIVIKVVIPFLIAWFVPSKLLIPAMVLLLAIIGWNLKELLLLFL
jgi:hypothetical protein